MFRPQLFAELFVQQRNLLKCENMLKTRTSSHVSYPSIFSECIEAICKPFKYLMMPRPSELSDFDEGRTLTIKEPFKLYNLHSGPEQRVHLTKAQAFEYYKQMQTIRRLEKAVAALYREKFIRGFCHLYSGQEACAVGIKAAMRCQDSAITAYRCHGWTYLMGVTATELLAELTGRQSGCSRGKGGSMHMYTSNFYGGNGIVGAQIPLGTGVALAHKYNEDGGVSFACYGDGAANQGQVFESYNMASLWKLPIIYVCENNRYGMGTKEDRAACNSSFYTRGEYVPGIWVDGMDVLAVRSASEFAIQYALNHGPIILELFTYRYMGHSMSDPGTSYRKREEIQEMRQKHDPITNFKNACISNEILDEVDITVMNDIIHKEIDDAVNIAKSDKEIEMKEATADVYARNLEPKIRGVNGFNISHIQIKKGSNYY